MERRAPGQGGVCLIWLSPDTSSLDVYENTPPSAAQREFSFVVSGKRSFKKRLELSLLVGYVRFMHV